MTETTVNPFLSKIKLPGKKIRLPSGGLLYTKGELDENVSNGEIEIFPLTAIDDIILSSPDRMLNGDGIIDVFKNIAPDVKKPLELFSQDFEEIMIHNHLITHGNDYTVNYSHECNNKPNQYTIDCSPFLKNSVPLDPSTINDRCTYLIETRVGVQQQIILRPRRVKHIIDITTMVKDVNMDYEKFQLSLLEGLLGSIHSIDNLELTDSTKIHAFEWVKQLKSKWIEELTNKLEDVDNWGPKLETTVTCKSCNEQIHLPVTLNPITFFL